MKKQLIFATTVASSVFAQGDYDDYCQPVCDPCCDRWGIVVDAEFLYWYAKENKLELALELKTTIVSPDPNETFAYTFPVKDHYMNVKWEPGVRVGLGFDSPCSRWDLYATWTGYWNTKTQSESVIPFFIGQNSVLPNEGAKYLLSPWHFPTETILVIPPTVANSYTYLDQVNGRWKLSYNVVDFQFGNEYCFTPCFHFRPFFGIRAGWTDIDFDLFQRGRSQQDASDALNLFHYDSAYSNQFWGVGLSGGVGSTWYFSSCFGLHGELSYALLWGEFDGKRKETLVALDDGILVYTYTWSMKNAFNGMQSIFDLGIDLRFEDSYCCDRYALCVDLGWEHHLWIHHVNRLQTGEVVPSNLGNAIFTNSLQSVVENETDLALGGLVLRVQFGF